MEDTFSKSRSINSNRVIQNPVNSMNISGSISSETFTDLLCDKQRTSVSGSMKSSSPDKLRTVELGQKLSSIGELNVNVDHNYEASSINLPSTRRLEVPLFPDLIDNDPEDSIIPSKKFNNVENCSIMSKTNMTVSSKTSSSPEKRSSVRWSKDEDDLLRAVVEKFKGKRWKEIAKEFSKVSRDSRTDIQCLHRYNKCLKPGLLKGPWSPEEDAIIVKEVTQHKGESRIKWTQIANKLTGRLGKQVRERWINHLNPNLNHSEWTVEEDLKLYSLQRNTGNKWKMIAQSLPGRSENAVKNRFHSLGTLYHLPQKGEELESNFDKHPEWLEMRRIKRTRKYKPRKSRASKKILPADYQPMSQTSKLLEVADLALLHVVDSEEDDYARLDFYNEDEALNLPHFDKNKVEKKKKRRKTVLKSKGITAHPEMLFPGQFTLTNIPSPFANNTNNFQLSRQTMHSELKCSEAPMFRRINQSRFEFEDKELQQRNLNLKPFVNCYPTNASIQNYIGIIDNNNYNFSNLGSLGLSNCFSFNAIPPELPTPRNQDISK